MSNVTVNRGSQDCGHVDSRGFKHIGQSERVVSMIAGTTLASAALRSRSLLSAALMLGASAGLIHRGATGKCGFSKMLSNMNSMMNDGINQLAERTGANAGSSSNSGSSRSRNSRHDEVNEAGKESFPASDPPSFTPVTGEAEKTHMNM